MNKDFVFFEGLDGVVYENIIEKYVGNGKNVEIPDSITSIEPLAFETTGDILSIKLPDTIIAVAQDAFVDIHETIRILRTNPNYVIEDGFMINKAQKAVLFPTDSYKKSYKIPEGIEIIGKSAFWYCRDMEKIEFPKSLKFIAPMNFEFTSNLKEYNLSDDVTVIQPSNSYIEKK